MLGKPRRRFDVGGSAAKRAASGQRRRRALQKLSHALHELVPEKPMAEAPEADGPALPPSMAREAAAQPRPPERHSGDAASGGERWGRQGDDRAAAMAARDGSTFDLVRKTRFPVRL